MWLPVRLLQTHPGLGDAVSLLGAAAEGPSFNEQVGERCSCRGQEAEMAEMEDERTLRRQLMALLGGTSRFSSVNITIQSFSAKV